MSIKGEIAEFRAAAIAECLICDARARGDCSEECRYWAATATEIDRVALILGMSRPGSYKTRGWIGAILSELELSQ